MQKYMDMLLENPLFDGIEARDLPVMLNCLGARVEKYQKGQTILAEGSPARDVGLMLEGAAQVVQVDYFGNRSLLAQAGKGQMFGESFACAGVASMPVQVVAAEDCRVLHLECARILRACCNACHFHSKLIFNLLKIVAEKNLSLHQRAEIISRRTTRDKLMAYLLIQAKRSASAEFSIPFDRQALADYLEVDRSGLSAEIGKLKKEGVIDCHKNIFRLLVRQ